MSAYGTDPWSKRDKLIVAVLSLIGYGLMLWGFAHG